MALPNPSLGLNRMRGLFVKFMHHQCSRLYSKSNQTKQVSKSIPIDSEEFMYTHQRGLTILRPIYKYFKVIRVIRPTPPPPPTGFDNITPERLILFALVGGVAGTSVLYLISKSEKKGVLFPFTTPQSSFSSR